MNARGTTGKDPEPPDYSEGSLQSLILLRWVLIIAIAYLVLLSRPLAELPPVAGLFIAFYLGSNLVLPPLLRKAREEYKAERLLVVLDVAAVTVALAMCSDHSSELFVLYFVVLFLSALTDGIALAAGAAIFISVAHLITASSFVDLGELVQRGYIARIPFLFAVAIFFGNLVQKARARERRERNAMLRSRRMEFLSTVSHDLRNPLGVIESLTDLLLDADAGPLNPEQNDLVQRIHASIRQVLNLSNNLIDAERIELGNFPLRKSVCDMRDVVGESLVLARTAADIKGVTLESKLPATPCLAHVDPMQIERALSNLLGNALKFTPAGGSVRVEVERSDAGVQVTVADSGPGIPPDLFRELGRKHVSGADGNPSGTGLGLYIASAISEAHGARLSAKTSELGTQFTINLPLPSNCDVRDDEKPVSFALAESC